MRAVKPVHRKLSFFSDSAAQDHPWRMPMACASRLRSSGHEPGGSCNVSATPPPRHSRQRHRACSGCTNAFVGSMPVAQALRACAAQRGCLAPQPRSGCGTWGPATQALRACAGRGSCGPQERSWTRLHRADASNSSISMGRLQFSSVAAALSPASSPRPYGRDGGCVARIGSGESPRPREPMRQLGLAARRSCRRHTPGMRRQRQHERLGSREGGLHSRGAPEGPSPWERAKQLHAADGPRSRIGSRPDPRHSSSQRVRPERESRYRKGNARQGRTRCVCPGDGVVGACARGGFDVLLGVHSTAEGGGKQQEGGRWLRHRLASFR